MSDTVPLSPKVSVVVPTYAPGHRLDRLVRSLEAQTMPASDFEVIFVDDGSPDRTWDNLQHIRNSHENVRIIRIANSGWPSRPRNVGLELAGGEYVLFMDHDDELYPRALEAGYGMAARTNADVLNGKETRTDQSKWAMDVYSANMDNAIERRDIHPLIPTNPHKLFRRGLLMEHGIRFPEGGRVLWEDVFFALDVAQHARVISVLADTPFYHWVRGGKTASSSYRDNLAEYWRWVREIVLQTNERLAGRDLEGQRRLMLLHQYRSRVLAALGPALFQASRQDLDVARSTVDDLIRHHIPDELDAELTPMQLGKAALVRSGRWDLLEKLVAVDADLVGISTTTSIGWVDGTLRIAAESRWAGGDGAALALRYDGDRIMRDLPEGVAAALPASAVDMTGSLRAARTSIAIRARDTAVCWMLPSECEVRVDRVDGRPDLIVSATASLNPATAIFGRPLDETSWDVTARNELVGVINQRGLRTSKPARSAVQDGHVYIAYRNKTGTLSLDVDERNRSLAGSAKLDPSGARFPVQRAPRWSQLLSRRRGGSAFELPFAGVATVDDTVIEGTLTIGASVPRPARIVARKDGAWLQSSVDQPPGTYSMTLGFHGREIDSGLDVIVGPHGELDITRTGGRSATSPRSTEEG